MRAKYIEFITMLYLHTSRSGCALIDLVSASYCSIVMRLLKYQVNISLLSPVKFHFKYSQNENLQALHQHFKDGGVFL